MKKTIMLRNICLTGIIATFMNGFAAKENKSVNITVDGAKRSYWLYVPDKCGATAPVVFALHGASGHSTDKSPHFNPIADKEGFIVVYPQGEPIYFPVFGGTVTGWDASGEENKDAAFIKAILDEIDNKYGIDRNRVYCCGFSNGGMMTYAMSNACSDIFAAFASISGFPLNEFHFRHTGTRPVPFLHIHGKNDDFVKYSLMPVIRDEIVARNDACPVAKKTTVAGKYDKSVYEATEGSFPYIYYEIDGMGHNDFTANTEDGSSSQTMWNFFKQYTLDTPCDKSLKWMPRIEQDGFNPAQHGFTVNSGKTVLCFGDEKQTSGNHNVYHSLQFDKGKYRLTFKSSGPAGKTVNVKISRWSDNAKDVLDKTVTVGEDASIDFDIEDSWGQYNITFLRSSTEDKITISDIRIHTISSDNTAIEYLPSSAAKPTTVETYYSLSGSRISNPKRGLTLCRMSDGTVRKMLSSN
ncbi:MAG: alpha/beta hydrolase family esterase [Prevotella sp.]